MMSFYGIETGLTSFLGRSEKRPIDRTETARRIAEKLAELRASGVFGDTDADTDDPEAIPSEGAA
jgi:hypothetical protein